MSKSILVIDTPENCRECPCHFTDMVTFNPKEGEKFFSNLCGVNNKGLDVEEMNNHKPDWCPLKEIPQKKKEIEIRRNNDYAVNLYSNGYNDCLDEILKECDGNNADNSK